MTELSRKTMTMLKKGSLGHSVIYRGLLELLARFGYVSLEEVRYGFGLTLKEAFNRLAFLEQAGLLQRFPSYSVPSFFLCLTFEGRQVVQDFGIAEEVSRFVASDYRPLFQRHSRLMVRTYLALKKILGSDFLGWSSEETLRRMAGASGLSPYGDPTGRRIWDGELRLRVFRESEGTLPPAGGVREEACLPDLPADRQGRQAWRCAVELELSLKSPYRYYRQFNALAYQVYDELSRQQLLPMVFFVCGTSSLRDHLLYHLGREDRLYGACVFYFGQADELFTKLGEAPLLRVMGNRRDMIRAGDMNRIREVNHEVA